MSSTVLIVDDNVDDAEVLSKLLRMFGHKSEVAHTVDSGLELVKKIKPVLVLCDIVMPEKDGFSFISALKSNKETRDITAWAVTVSEVNPEKIKSKGFDDFVYKPLITKAFMEKVETFFFTRKKRLIDDSTGILEVMNAWWLTSYGIGFSIYPVVERSVSYKSLYQLAPEWFWMVMLIATGLFATFGILKGRPWRRRAAFASAIVWTSVCASIIQTVGPTLAFWVFSNMGLAMWYAFVRNPKK